MAAARFHSITDIYRPAGWPSGDETCISLTGTRMPQILCEGFPRLVCVMLKETMPNQEWPFSASLSARLHAVATAAHGNGGTVLKEQFTVTSASGDVGETSPVAVALVQCGAAAGMIPSCPNPVTKSCTATAVSSRPNTTSETTRLAGFMRFASTSILVNSR